MIWKNKEKVKIEITICGLKCKSEAHIDFLDFPQMLEDIKEKTLGRIKQVKKSRMEVK